MGHGENIKYYIVLRS